MLKHLVLDMGRVMVDYHPDAIWHRFGVTDEGDLRLLREVVTDSPEWALMDWGYLSDTAFETIARPKLPERLHAVLHRYLFRWFDPIEPVPGMAELVRDYKKRGLGIYLLSNASPRQHDYWPMVPGHEVFDGTVISADVKLVKPMPDIYRLLLDRFRLRAQDCLFVDDVAANVAAARLVGMDGFVFRYNPEDLRRYIDRRLSETPSAD